ncbi:unnamed protein product [Notodromas monacha]|uniref:S-formylglutathione hydrolase n=1 Tax=Notodromas monacha TaxID=399045 RepID=A0A7R9BIF0_9CRUS|nr:unnamed protein product [Notodromas monacha]CAG0916086.1 unnamed protein product [Notodromas monacha]
MSLNEESSAKCFGGLQKVFSHDSVETKCRMRFSVYLPPKVFEENFQDGKLPVVYYLSGLTCTEENFIHKSGVQKYAAELGLIIIGPDTSPRNVGVSGENDSWDFGTGAGFYVDATEPLWASNYRMYSYVTKELPAIIEKNFPASSSARSIFGHSMGGHGALICALKNPGHYKSVSAFAPICNPSECPWGVKAFSGYLGANKESWKDYDATALTRGYSGEKIKLLVDTGTADKFYQDCQLLPENLKNAVDGNSDAFDAKFRFHGGYDHSYYFIASFIGEHLKFHASALQTEIA